MATLQTGAVVDQLVAANPGLQVELVHVATAGDRDQSTPLASGSGAGWFTSALQDALLRNEVDVAVHSYKDLPTKRPEGLVIAAIPKRDDPRDALISRGRLPLRHLPAGAIVGTGSPRREAQLLGIRQDIEVRPIRGNVDTRIRKVDEGEYDAIVVALAGLRRLGAEERVTEVFSVYDLLPAPAQGALAIECRAADIDIRTLLRSIDDPDSRQLVTAERSFLAAIDAGCAFPAAAYAEHFGSTLKLHGLLAPGGKIVRAKNAGQGDAAAGLGRELAEELMAAAGMKR
jgi:hydroxymethylbilane synthase